jgi:signal transduction histidine kinase
MQTELATMLQQKNHLAALGLAVSKVSHDLRNMLTSAQLISDRLSNVEDPTVKRFAPKLIGSLDRAIEFLSQTLKFGRAQELPPRRERLGLGGLVDEVIEAAVVQEPSRIRIFNNVPPGILIDADREQLIRVLTNLMRNAIQAIESSQAERRDGPDGEITLWARREGSVTVIEVRDNGPGIPNQMRDRLFQAFQSAARQGGTGLGLAIAAELIRAHGGDIQLQSSTEVGTCFVIAIPDQVTQLRTGRNGDRRTSLNASPGG